MSFADARVLLRLGRSLQGKDFFLLLESKFWASLATQGGFSFETRIWEAKGPLEFAMIPRLLKGQMPFFLRMRPYAFLTQLCFTIFPILVEIERPCS